MAAAAHSGTDKHRADIQRKANQQKVKIGLGGLIVILIAPTLPASNIPIFSAAGLWLAIQQILIGVALGLTMQFAFAAVRLAGK